MPIPLTIRCYSPGTYGEPSTTMPIPLELSSRAESYQHTISDRFGFESMAVSFKCSLDETNYWLQNGLMCSVVVYGPDAQIVWEGFLETVSATLGQKKASLSLANMSNYMHAVYTDAGGTQRTSNTASDQGSINRFGVKEIITTLQQSTLAAANNAVINVLGQRAWPRSRETTEAATGGGGDIAIDLSFAGWYSTLGWTLLTLGRNSTTNTDTGTQISGYVLPTAYSDNAFLSTDYTHIATTGVTNSEYIAPYTPYTRAIEALLALGNSGNQQLTWGVYEDRVFKTAVWAGATPTVITYTEDAGTGLIFDTYGNTVAPWDVRPNAMSQVVQLLDVGTPTGAIDAAARKYVGRVTCHIQGDSVGCTLEPSQTDSIEAFLATLTGK